MKGGPPCAGRLFLWSAHNDLPYDFPAEFLVQASSPLGPPEVNFLSPRRRLDSDEQTIPFHPGFVNLGTNRICQQLMPRIHDAALHHPVLNSHGPGQISEDISKRLRRSVAGCSHTAKIAAEWTRCRTTIRDSSRCFVASGMKHLETRLAHIGTGADPASAAIAPPIHLSTNYEAKPDGSFGAYKYSRIGNPTRDRFERSLSDLEGAEDCVAFASGMAAASGLLHALDPGDEIVLAEDVYHGVAAWAEQHFSRWGGRVIRFDPRSSDELGSRLTDRTRLVWIETPSNPNLGITDISAVATVVHEAGALLVCDSTFSTPVLTRPIEHGADIVLHSATKYLAGHSDALGGAVLFAGTSPISERTRSIQTMGGAVMDPFTAWLTMRGMRSLGARLRMICDSAVRIAEFLEAADDILQVNYPGLASHPGYETARTQMDGFGGMISFRVDGAEEDARRIVSRATLFTRATSLGGTESLIEHRRTSEGPNSTTPADLIRLSIGLEHPDDLIEDLRQALSA